jgi:hypothetical protein
MIADMHFSASARLVPLAFAAALLAGCGTPPASPPAPVARPVEAPVDTRLPPAATRALARRFPYMQAIAHSAGRLQVDDADDLAVVLAPIGQTHDTVVAVLVTGPAGEYRVATASRVVAPGCEACTTTVDVARHVLSVHLQRPFDPDFERITWQFAYRTADVGLRLVGVTAAQPPGDDPIAHGYAISTDLVEGAKVDTLDPTAADPARRRELKSRVPVRPAITFDAFAFTPQALAPELRREPVSAFEPAEPLPAAAAALLRARFPGAVVQARSVGALRADSLRDLAVVLAAPAAAGADADTTLALLLAQPDGRLRLAATSGPLARGCRDCDVQVQIAHKALVVQTTSVDAAGRHVVGWQFMASAKDRAGALRLVGVRTVLESRHGDGDTHRDVVTANLVSGDKLEVAEAVVRGHRSRSEHASKVPPRPPMLLPGFVFDISRLDAETRRDFTP